jgi:hypothetical protein
MISSTGRTKTYPNIQNMPGSIADRIDKLMERGETIKVDGLLMMCKIIARVNQ